LERVFFVGGYINKNMRLLKLNEHAGRVLLIVDVQGSFSKFFNEKYLNGLFDYCKQFDKVYQIFDNHPEGPYPDVDYLYANAPSGPAQNDLYTFPNETDKIEKRYLYNANVDTFKKILSEGDYTKIKELEQSKQLKLGDKFAAAGDTEIVYVGNKHGWYHIPKRMLELFGELKNTPIEIVGGSHGECLLDIQAAAKAHGLKTFVNEKYVYSAKGPKHY